jgi:hypothetical protein
MILLALSILSGPAGHTAIVVSSRLGHRRSLRVGSEVVGPWGLALLALGAALAGSLAVLGAGNGGLPAASSALPSQAGRAPSTTVAHHARRSPAPAKTHASQGSVTQKLGPPLSSTPYAPYAFRVYPGPRSAATRQALAGFQVRVTPEGTRFKLTVLLVGSGQRAVSKTYPVGDRVYFIEASLGDDAGSSELNLGDDGILVTNPQGRIVQ